MNRIAFDNLEDVSDYLRQIDLEISWGEDESYKYRIREYVFVPKSD
ncbi:MAG: hypothetical protein JRF53_16590 [Deltaproteobacteria bacterium]|nr:hypothetical protein [Deltaproteobacteria bacterium]